MAAESTPPKLKAGDRFFKDIAVSNVSGDCKIGNTVDITLIIKKLNVINFPGDVTTSITTTAGDTKLGTSSALKIEDFVFGMLYSILYPNSCDQSKAMDFNKLYSEFNKIYGKDQYGNVRTFPDIAGCQLKVFIERHRKNFSLVHKQGKLEVSLIVPKTDVENFLSGMLPLIEAAHEETVESYHNRIQKEKIEREIRNENLKNAVTSDVKSQTSEKTCSSETDPEIFIKELLTRGVDDTLIIREDIFQEYRYSCNIALVIDIVSLWNTPNTENSYIMIGIKNKKGRNEIVGIIGDAFTNAMCQSMFDDSLFSYRPYFQFKSIRMDNKAYVGLIEIPRNRGNTEPCWPIKDLEGTPIKECQLIMRTNKKTAVYSPDAKQYRATMIWFMRYANVLVPEIPEDVSKEKDGSEQVVRLLKDAGSSRHGHYILILGGSLEKVKNIDALAYIPWLYVFDFHTSATMKDMCFNIMEKRCSCYCSTWKAMPPFPNNSSVTWCFVRGYYGESETLAETVYNKWRSQVRNGVENHCRQLGKFVSGYTVLKVVVLWGEDEDYLPHLLYLLQSLEGELEITICFEKETCSENGIRHRKNIQESVCIKSEYCMEISNLCLKLSASGGITRNANVGKLRLPGLDNEGEEGELTMKEKEAAWLNEELDVLYLDGTFMQEMRSTEDQMKEEKHFYKGGNLSWNAWYEKDVGYYDVKRDVMDGLKNEIHRIIKSAKSAWITLCHAPGSGGTTLAQRILMDFRKIVPCAKLKRQPTSMTEFIEKLQMIYRETYKTILLVIDGEDQNWVRQLVSSTKEIKILVLYVQLYLARIDTNRPPINNVFFLNGEVTKSEAPLFSSTFGSQCATMEQKNNVHRLAKAVENGTPNYVYEFGLTAFLHEFQGLEKYVRGYLNLENAKKLSDLEPWQKALAYAALAFFYGHSPMPLQFFASMLGVPSNEVVVLDDFQSGQQFLIHDSSDCRLIRVCNFYVAREILNQVLTYGIRTERNHNPFIINKEASINLLELSLDFIDECRQKSLNTYITKVLVKKMFFSRDNSETGESTGSLHTSASPSRKHKLSRLLEAIPGDYPYTEKEKLMLNISEAFSENPLFQAHLGRFYYTYRPTDRKKAEDALQRALKLCESQTPRYSTKEDEENTKTIFVHVHHMYGMMYATFISYLAKKRKKNELEFHNDLTQIIELATKAIMHFRESYVHMVNSGIYTDHPAVGQMRVRLQVSEYMKICKGGLKLYLKDKRRNEDAVKFLYETVPAIDFLILDCCANIDTNDMSDDFIRNIQLYKVLHTHVPDIINWVHDVETIHSRRFKIAVLKEQYSRDIWTIPTLEDITKSKDIQTVVKLYEEVIKEAHYDTSLLKTAEMERDMQEWLYAIRHSKFNQNYEVTHVLEFVQLWNNYRQSPLSQFYVFVLKSLLGLGTSETSRDLQCLIEATSMVGKMLPKHNTTWVRKPRYPREWLGKNQNGIKRLISRSLLGNLDHNSQATEVEINTRIKQLELCSGTVRSPNVSRLHGEIELVFGNKAPAHQVKVFYIPVKNNLVGRRFAGKKVDFYLAFSLEHGYEAFTVEQLKTVNCSQCSTMVEQSLKQDLACKCCKTTITAAKD